MILDIIQQNYHSFTPKEQKIATYIMQKKHLKNMNITKLANILNTSPATITRFCKKIDCANFAEMKINLVDESTRESIVNKDTIFDAIHTYYTTVMDNTNKLVNPQDIEETIEAIIRAKKIYIYGVGSSGLTALEFMQRLIRMGFNVSCFTDTHMMLISQTLLTPDDLVIGISSSGQTVEIVNMLAIAKKVGAKTISITSFIDSQIVQYSDISLIVYSSKFVNNTSFVNSQFAMMFIVDILTMILLDDKDYNTMMQETIQTILDRK